MKRSIRTAVSEHFSVASLAKCMRVSRPTIYKYMDAYDRGREDEVPENVRNIFSTVCERIPENGLDSYFNRMMAEHYREMEENGDVPEDIAETIDNEGVTSNKIDRMIERARSHLEWLTVNNGDPEEIASVEKDLSDLEYSRDMVERHMKQRRFILIANMGSWTSSDGKNTYPFTEKNEAEVPGIRDMFRWSLVEQMSGYTVFFDNEGSDSVRVVLLACPGDDEVLRPMGTFHPDTGMNFIRIPDLFMQDYHDWFRYRIERVRDGEVVDSAVCTFEH